MNMYAGECEIEPADPMADEVRRCTEAYYGDLSRRFGQRLTLEKYPNPPRAELMPPRGVFLIAQDGGVPVGCGALTTLEPRVGYVSRMWVAEAMRGRGLGRRVLEVLEHWAVRFGLERVRLYTHESLTEAQAMYRQLQYVEVAATREDAPFADIWFEKQL